MVLFDPVKSADPPITREFFLVKKVKIYLQEKYNTDAFNVGINCGEVAGQTVFHAHIHIIPRYKGDVAKPRGGVRNIIPGKGDY